MSSLHLVRPPSPSSSTARVVSTLVLATTLLGTPLVRGAEYFALPAAALELAPGEPFETIRNRDRVPYAILNGPGEIYLEMNEFGNLSLDGIVVHIRVPDGASPEGRFFYPRSGQDGMVSAPIAVRGNSARSDAAKFREAKREHYRRLWQRGLPGSAYFRHRYLETLEEADAPQDPARRREPRPRNELARTYELFSGGRAVAENLQLDRQLDPRPGPGELVAVETLTGVTTNEIDWTERVAEIDPELDPLARFIPADQHALFFSSFHDLTRLVDEATRQGTPILFEIEPRAEDARTRERYERQLCLSLDAMTRAIGPQLVKSVALTGGDPYLRTGSDVALVFEATSPVALRTLLVGRHAQVQQTTPAARPVEGTIGETPFVGLRTPDRSVCSLIMVIDQTVVVSNSRGQLERIAGAVGGSQPSLHSLPEYRFFRHRYARADGTETALLILSDATIRRWSSPRWRIAASRRTRAAAFLSHLQARHQPTLLESPGVARTLPAEPSSAVELGELSLTPRGVISSEYGSLDFLTPISELRVDQVTRAEAEAYEVFRRNYQRNWRAFFDPIAVRFSVTQGAIGVDLTVMPLIAGSEYRNLIELTGDARIRAGSGDPHPESLLHFALAIDSSSREIQQAAGFLSFGARGGVHPFSWLGESVSVYLDRDEILAELQGAQDPEALLERSWPRLPIALHVEVKNSLALTAFLTSLRGMVDQSAPGMTVWTNHTHNGMPYVRVSPTETRDENWEDVALHYAVRPNFLVLSLREDVIQRALDREARRAQAEGESTADGTPTMEWLGDHVGVVASAEVLTFLSQVFDDEWRGRLRSRSWHNLPILNEWKRRFPGHDPVALHEKIWKTRLVCPGGGRYVWNEANRCMESTVFGCPAAVRRGPDAWPLLEGLRRLRLGLTFEDDGLRARIDLSRKTPKGE